MDEAQKAYAFALKALTRRDHSESEIRSKMTGRQVPLPVVEEVLVRLKRSGYLDDERFARQWAESAVRNGRGYGCRIRHELLRRGIPDDLASAVVAEIRDEYDEEGTIQSLLARKLAGVAPVVADSKLKRRIIGYLQRRGFSTSAIMQALQHMED